MKFHFGNFKILFRSKFQIPNSRFSRASGMTTLELLISLALFVILAVGFSDLAQLFTSYGSLLPSEELKSQVTREHQIAVDDLERTIRGAESVQANYVTTSTTYTTATTTLVLHLRSYDSASNFLSNTFDTAVYYLATGTLYKLVVPASNSSRPSSNGALNNAVQSLTFTYNATSSANISNILINLITSKTINRTTAGASSTVSVTLR